MYFLCLYGPVCISTQNLLPSMTVARGARLTREEAWSSRGRFSNDATLGLVRWGKVPAPISAAEWSASIRKRSLLHLPRSLTASRIVAINERKRLSSRFRAAFPYTYIYIRSKYTGKGGAIMPEIFV